MTLISSKEQLLHKAHTFFDSFSPRIQSYAIWNGVQIDMLREDESHQWISGNKFRKLKYNCLQGLSDSKTPWITFGGAHSNHLAAFSYACDFFGVKGLVYVRGEELEDVSKWDRTLHFAYANGIALRFISRKGYREKDELYQQIYDEFPNALIIPEGGTNVLGVKGCEEAYKNVISDYDWVACAVGTGGTFSGLMKAVHSHQKAIGVAVLKADLWKDIRTFAPTEKGILYDQYHFGGYAKVTKALVDFIKQQYELNPIYLDPIYTGKLVYALHQEVNSGVLEGKKGLIIHTGGLQGIFATNKVLKEKSWPLLPEPLDMFFI